MDHVQGGTTHLALNNFSNLIAYSLRSQSLVGMLAKVLIYKEEVSKIAEGPVFLT